MSIPPSIRGELDQTPEWWNAQYKALVRKQIPRDLASHEGHSIERVRTYMNALMYVTCTDCGVSIREDT